MPADLHRYFGCLDLLAVLPERFPPVRITAVSGSAVTGGHDMHSDLDVQAWCDGATGPTDDAVLAELTP